MIFDPPAPPINSATLLFESKIIDGHIDDNGRLPGLMKFDGDASKPFGFLKPGREKSSISSFRRMPVFLERSRAPSLKRIDMENEWKCMELNAPLSLTLN